MQRGEGEKERASIGDASSHESTIRGWNLRRRKQKERQSLNRLEVDRFYTGQKDWQKKKKKKKKKKEVLRWT